MEEKIQIKTGDQVRLRSGGPLRTVGEISNNAINVETALCYWFVDTNTRLRTAWINTKALKHSV